MISKKPKQPELNIKQQPGQQEPDSSEYVRLYPSIYFAVRRQGLDAVYRMFLICIDHDQQGSGKFSLERLRSLVPFGRSQFYNLLSKGDGLFWTRGGPNIYLHSHDRIAAKLGLGSITGRPVDVPCYDLYHGIQRFRAACYAALDSSRKDNTRPITRATRQSITGATTNTQKAYERIAGTTTKKNFAILDDYSNYNLNRQRIHYHRPAFRMQDTHGIAGAKNRAYVAQQTANTYTPPASQRTRSRTGTRRINKKLAALCTYGDEGNGHFDKVWYPAQDQRIAAAVGGYWQRADTGTCGVWMLEPGQAAKQQEAAHV